MDLMNKISISELNVTNQIKGIEAAMQEQVDQLMCARVETDYFTVNEFDTLLTAMETKTLYGPWCVQ